MRDDGGETFFATLISSALSTGGAHDLLSLLSSGAARVEIVGLSMQQLSTAPTPAAVEIFRGSTAAAVGSSIPAVTREGWASKPVAKSGLNANSSTLLSTASAARVHAGGFTADGGKFAWKPETPTVLDTSQRLHIRCGTPNVATSIALSIEFRERGKIPG